MPQWICGGGKWDPTSTMLWSPRKHAGQKKPMESEEEESNNEAMTEEVATSEDDQDEETLSAEEEGDQQWHKGEPRRHAEKASTELGRDL